MKIIVIGASGLLGKYVYSLLQDEGIHTRGTYYKNYSKGLYQFDLANDSITQIFPDILSDSEEKKYVILCAAERDLNKAFNNKSRSNLINVEATKKLIEDCNKHNIKCIFFSSEMVFDGIKGYYTEEDTTKPINLYGLQKECIEEYILRLNYDNLIFRISKIVSDVVNEDIFFTDIMDKVKRNEDIRCIENQCFSPTYVRDIARATLFAIKQDMKGLYNVSNPEIFSRSELVFQLLNEFGIERRIRTLELEKFNFPEPRPLKTYLDSSKFRNEVNMQFASMKTVILKYIKNYKNYNRSVT